MTLVATINGYEAHLPTSGGKAGRGNNKTSTLQIRRDGMIKKQFRFLVVDGVPEAAMKAKAWIQSQVQQSVTERAKVTA